MKWEQKEIGEVWMHHPSADMEILQNFSASEAWSANYSATATKSKVDILKFQKRVF